MNTSMSSALHTQNIQILISIIKEEMLCPQHVEQNQNIKQRFCGVGCFSSELQLVDPEF